jgi:hypothetical protein
MHFLVYIVEHIFIVQTNAEIKIGKKIDLILIHRDKYHKSKCSAMAGNISMDTSGLDMSGISDNQSKKKKSIEDYEIVNEKKSDLGKGAYGQVRLVREKADPSKLYAMKIVTLLNFLNSRSTKLV